MGDRVEDWVGKQLGQYRLLHLLGQGGFAQVYLGEHSYLHSLAALKVLRAVFTPEELDGFVKEAGLLARLIHPHIVRVLDFAVENGTPFLVMEYAPHGTLRHRHPHGTRLEPEIIVSYVQQAASALQYAHEQHLVHRDVKPENMLIGMQDQVLLSDFGLAMLLSHSSMYSTEVHVDRLVGTAPYLAPEQLRGKPQMASDQYSLGVVTYEWICGRQPFLGNALEIATQHITEPPPSLREQVPDLPAAVEETVLRALAKDPTQRFASVQDFALTVEHAYQVGEAARPWHLYTQEVQSPQITAKSERLWKLPTTFTALVGREPEVAACRTLLQRPEVRLLTLLGTGGVGKTRLGLEVAQQLWDDFADGACFVSLAPISDPDLVLPSIAQELGIQETGTQPLLEQVKLALQQKHLLLLLDNFEQVVPAAPLITQILAVCPHLKVLVTSRELLHLQGEYVFAVTPLTLPDLMQLSGSEALRQSAAVQLFVQRAQALLPAFQLSAANERAVAKICVRLDGLPLALELAAARIKLLPPQALLSRLTHRLQVLTGGGQTLPTRQQTLRNTLKWSYDLLTPGEQKLFRLLSVFVGGFTLEAVEALWSAIAVQEDEETPLLDSIASLIDKSLLLQLEQEGEEPHLLLLETVREYGLECLQQSGEAETFRWAHALHYLALAEEAAPQLKGRRQLYWLVRLEREQENWRAALAWFIEHEEAAYALRCCGALWWFWHLRGYWSEGRRWLAAALGMQQPAEATEPTVARALALCAVGDLAYYQDDYQAGRLLLEESVALCRKLGSREDLARALGILGVLIHVQGDPVAARPILEESEKLCRSLDNTWELAYLLRKLGYIGWWEGNLEQAAVYAQEGLVLVRELGDQALIATTLCTLGEIVADHTDLTQAVAYAQEGLALARELGDQTLISIVTQNLGYLLFLQRDLTQATVYAQEGLAVARELGDKMSILLALHSLGCIASKQEEWKHARAYFEESLRMALEVGNELQAGWDLVGLAEVTAGEGEFERAAHLLGAAETRLDVNAHMNVIERADYDRTVEHVRTQLGENAFAAVWARGRMMTPEQALLAPELAAILARPLPTPAAKPLSTAAHPDELTAREVEVLRLVAQGLTNPQIAEQLILSIHTVNAHVRSIYTKLGINSRSALTRYAMEHHLI